MRDTGPFAVAQPGWSARGAAGWPARYPAPGGWWTPERRSWLLVALVLMLIGALGVGGGLLLARRFAAPPGGQLVSVRELSYRVPAGWRVGPGGPETAIGEVALDGVASAGDYRCGGRDQHRATVGATFLVRRDGANARAEDAVRDFGPLFAASFYGTGSTVTASAPAPITVDERPASTSLVAVRSAGCPGLVGRITVVAAPSSRTGAAGGTGVLLLVARHDTAGGPAAPPLVTDRAVEELLASVRLAR